MADATVSTSSASTSKDTTQKRKLEESVGPKSPFVRLVSNDGHEFIIHQKFVEPSPTIKAMLEMPVGACDEKENEIPFRDIASLVLQKVCHYFQYYTHYMDKPVEIPEFPISAELSLEMLMVANFLDC